MPVEVCVHTCAFDFIYTPYKECMPVAVSVHTHTYDIQCSLAMLHLKTALFSLRILKSWHF